MADISKELAAIAAAIYGEEVRGSISDALTKMNQSLSTITSASDSDILEINDKIDRLLNDYGITKESLQSQIDTLGMGSGILADDFGLEQDTDTGLVYPTYKGIRSENGIPLAASGGGGGTGGGDINSAVFTMANTTGWLSKTINEGGSCPLSFTWSSTEDGLSTGNGSLRITVNNIVRATRDVTQGNVSIDVGSYLSSGSNSVKIRISDVYNNGKTIIFNITSVSLTLSSSFDPGVPYYDTDIQFPYVPSGDIDKKVYFVVDDVQIGSVETSVSGRQLSFTIPKKAHGSHTLRVYFEAEIEGETVRSNELYYQYIQVITGNESGIISSSYNNFTVEQYTLINVNFYVFLPNSLTADVTIKANGNVISNITVDRSEQNFSYRADDVGNLTLEIICGGISKGFNITVTELDIDVEAETEGLELYLTSFGRSNNEENPAQWSYNDIFVDFNDFNWNSDGWVSDEDGVVVLRSFGGANGTIHYKPFEKDFRSSGKTIEIEFATRDVFDYDAVLMSCMSSGIGFKITAQQASLYSEQSELYTSYKEDEHVRLSFVITKTSDYRLIFLYINGIASGCTRYPTNDDFQQATPVEITFGNKDCTLDIYNIRVYDHDLTRYQIVSNWIADTQIGSLMLERYTRNNIYNAYGDIVIDKLPSDLPYLIFKSSRLPQIKDDKIPTELQYVDPTSVARSFNATFQLKVQGTSSLAYFVKNFKGKVDGKFTLGTGFEADKYSLRTGATSMPVKGFCWKADVASSEGANNVELVRLYNNICPYKTPAQEEDSRVRQGIDGFPIVLFWDNGSETTFWGKYNFNNDKGTEEVFGFAYPDESWEQKNNNSVRNLWKSNDFSGSDWLNDFEARYPDTDPAYSDPAQLKEFADWIVQTDRTAATNENLPKSVTYDGVTYVKDTAEYRLAKFKAEIGNYCELQSAIFYYLFTELFLMVDSRAKNAFPSFIGESLEASA